MPQFEIINQGSLIGFRALNAEAAEWWADNVEDGPALGAVHYVEARFAAPIIDGLAAEGLI